MTVRMAFPLTISDTISYAIFVLIISLGIKHYSLLQINFNLDVAMYIHEVSLQQNPRSPLTKVSSFNHLQDSWATPPMSPQFLPSRSPQFFPNTGHAPQTPRTPQFPAFPPLVRIVINLNYCSHRTLGTRIAWFGF